MDEAIVVEGRKHLLPLEGNPHCHCRCCSLSNIVVLLAVVGILSKTIIVLLAAKYVQQTKLGDCPCYCSRL